MNSQEKSATEQFDIEELEKIIEDSSKNDCLSNLSIDCNLLNSEELNHEICESDQIDSAGKNFEDRIFENELFRIVMY